VLVGPQFDQRFRTGGLHVALLPGLRFQQRAV
jgi:hypothetical protein